jgi:hypothetical protein
MLRFLKLICKPLLIVVRIWSLSLGEKASENKIEAVGVTLLRTIFAIINLGTCIFITLNIIFSWGYFS